ncbi:DNA repair protein RecN [Planctomycetes bacterium Pla163]|uniref:DNA repair protein RecN n=1 Tax=Rohdeia mirabilis TaxID=2528008 RepID=A0A518CW99_9BACT|nr:DNA repair protein RecN [Planctomycetes bacterium Pla163]
MLHELRVRDFALIDRLTVGFGPGLNAITGETGSGKSLIVTALELLGGARPRGGVGIWVRAGAERAVLEASFDVPRPTDPTHAAVSAWFERHLPELDGERWSEDGELLVVRVLDGGGRSRARVQGLSVTVAALGELVRELLEVNGQFEQRAVNEPTRQTAWFDEIADRRAADTATGRTVRKGSDPGGSSIADALTVYVAAREDWLGRRAERLALEERARERDGRATFLRIALEELEALDPRGGEGSELRRERELLRQSEQVVGDLGATAGALSEGEDPLISQVAVVADRVARWANAADPLHQVAESLSTGLLHLEDAAARLVSFLGGVESDPQRLEQVEVRLAALERAARRHGLDVDRLALHVEALRTEADELDDLDGARERLRRDESVALARVEDAARELTERRRERAGTLTEMVQPLLDRLGLAQARLDVCFTERGAVGGAVGGALGGGDDAEDGEADGARRFGPTGVEDVTLSWSPNPGEPARPLAHIASGGEAARVFLALRCAATGAVFGEAPRAAGPRRSTGAEPDLDTASLRTHTLVFDEVDAAVGGRLAPKVAECLAALARGGQVLTVTHQPAIAARADRHLAVVKRTRDGRTSAQAVVLEGSARLSEIAAMVGGSGRSATARAEAERLLACGGVRRARAGTEEARGGAPHGVASQSAANRTAANQTGASTGDASAPAEALRSGRRPAKTATRPADANANSNGGGRSTSAQDGTRPKTGSPALDPASASASTAPVPTRAPSPRASTARRGSRPSSRKSA